VPEKAALQRAAGGPRGADTAYAGATHGDVRPTKIKPRRSSDTRPQGRHGSANRAFRGAPQPRLAASEQPRRWLLLPRCGQRSSPNWWFQRRSSPSRRA
jgi:hypothetical protein